MSRASSAMRQGGRQTQNGASLLTRVRTAPPTVSSRRRGIWLYIPALVFMMIMTQIPFVLSVWFSLHSWNLLMPGEGFPFVGLANYINEFFTDHDFWPVIGHTIELVFGAMALALIGGTVLALLLNRPIWGRNVLRGLVTVPFLVTPSVMALVWKNLLLSPNFGVIDWALHTVGLPAVPWYSIFPLESVTGNVAWEWTPFVMLVLLAGLQAIPDEVLEAARVDGTNAWTTFWWIIFPMLRRSYEVAILFGTIFIFQTFGEIYLTTGGGPGVATNTLPYYTYKTAFNAWQIGQAAALGVIGVIIAIFAARVMLRFTADHTPEERG
ncbi:MAG TPA: sugar ABC transporter permease [Ktedonobacteraceae bacterium]|jgi:sorbitol/mannitol transport system permease protein|nr:sugar ABC transporter permease [Ktedonobacteraceae bacterium]